MSDELPVIIKIGVPCRPEQHRRRYAEATAAKVISDHFGVCAISKSSLDRCELAQLLVHQRQQLLGGVNVAVCEVGQDLSDLVHRSPERKSLLQKTATVMLWPI